MASSPTRTLRATSRSAERCAAPLRRANRSLPCGADWARLTRSAPPLLQMAVRRAMERIADDEGDEGALAGRLLTRAWCARRESVRWPPPARPCSPRSARTAA